MDNVSVFKYELYTHDKCVKCFDSMVTTSRNLKGLASPLYTLWSIKLSYNKFGDQNFGEP